MAVMTTTNSGLMSSGIKMTEVKLLRNIVIDAANGEKRIAIAGEVVYLPHYLAMELLETERVSLDLDAEVPLLPYQLEQVEAKKKKGKE